MAQFRIEGLEKLRKRLNRATVEMKSRVDMEMKVFVTEVNAEQVSLAPIDTGKLRQGVSFIRRGEMSYELFTNVEYAPFMEFGTGKYVSVPNDPTAQAQAQAAKGKGIREVNITPRPFFFAPYFTRKPGLLKRIEKVLLK